jgi:hypothetical protein
MMNKKIGVLSFFVFVALTGLVFAGVSGPSPIPNPPTFSISSNVLLVCKGETNYIPITVMDDELSNPSIGVSDLNGTAMQFVELSINPSKTLLPSGNGTAYIGNINPASSNTVYLPVFVSTNASLITTMGVGIDYYYLTYYSDSETRNITFEAATCPSTLSVTVEPKTVSSGEIQNISINLTNTGNATLNDLFVHYVVPSADGAIVGSSETEVGALAPGIRYRLNTSMFVSRNASIESFPFNVTATFYNGNYSIEQVSNSTSMIPIGAIDLSASGLTLSPTTVTPGGIISISFVLTDIGTTGASAVNVGAVLPSGFTSFGTNPVYVGDISADAQSPVTLTLEASNTLNPGTYNVPIQVSYLNSLRQNISSTSNVAIVVSSAASGQLGSGGTFVRTSSGGSGRLLIPIILRIIIRALAYLFMRERKKNKKGAK